MSTYEPPRGLRDFPPGMMELRANVVAAIERIFLDYSFKRWDGPAFESLETLKRKAGPGVVNEIYTFLDKGGRELGLRFELTTSLARIIAGNPRLKKPVKTFSIGKVWRYERPQEGRYREFLQADADIFGSDSMGCESELLLMGANAMERLGFPDYTIRLNNRKLLYAQAALARIPKEKYADALRSLDKLRKIGVDGVKSEFERSGLGGEAFERFMRLLVTEGTNTERMRRTSLLLEGSVLAAEGLEELTKIVDTLEGTSVLDRLVLDLSLVRGLDYYTGPIFEIEIASGTEVGSVSGGGRYDSLVELFGGRPTPAVGLSFGIERIIDLIDKDPERSKRYAAPAPIVQVIYQDGYLPDGLRIANHLRTQGIATDIDLKSRSFTKQIALAGQKSVRYAVIIGETEAKHGTCTLRDLESRNQESCSLHELTNKIKNVETL